MSTDLTIIPASGSDIPELVVLINSAYRGDSSKKGWTTEADLLDGTRTDPASLLELMQQPGQTILKAVDSFGKIIACVSLQQKGGLIYLGMLTVQPDIQAKGIGKALLSAAEKHAIQQGIHTIEMTVISVRSELIAWYERRGYQPTGEKRDFPSDPKFGIQKQALEFVVLEKQLA